MSKEQLEEEIKNIEELNGIMISSAFMVGFDVEAETEKVLKSLDQRIRVNIWQKNRLRVLRGLVEDLEESN